MNRRHLDLLLSRPCQLLVFGLLFLLCHLLLPAAARAQRAGLWVAGAGQPLKVVRHDVEVTINHPVAETVVTQEFQNPHSYNVETYFVYPVPAGATVTGMALWVNGARRDARMLERQQAREIYNGIVRQKRDPALLERVDGDTFRIRIFPVLARSRQRVELRFAQPVEMLTREQYRLTLRRPPGQKIHALRLGLELRSPVALEAVRLEGYPRRLQRQREAYVLPMGAEKRSFAKEIKLHYRARESGFASMAATTHGKDRLFVAELPLDGGDAAPRQVAVLLDSSRSMGRHRAVALTLVKQILGRLQRRDRGTVVPFQLLPRWPVKLSALDPAARGKVMDRLASLSWARGTAFAPAVTRALTAGARHLVLITDGGTRYHQAELEHLLRLLYDRPGVTISVVAMAGAVNQAALSELATATGGIFQRQDTVKHSASLAARLARLQSNDGVTMQGEGAVQVLRREPGRLLVAGRVPASARQVELRLTGAQSVHRLRFPPQQARAARGLWAAAKIQRTMHRIKLFGEQVALRQEVVKLSRTHNVLSEYTALLATETDADYQRKTSGRSWQRKTPDVGDDLPDASFDSTPEPHEWALIGIALLMLVAMRRPEKVKKTPLPS